MTTIFVLLIGSVASFSNPDSLRTETVNGKLFVIHQVDKKETLFSISRRYNVEVKSILESNPGADSGIDAGQLLKVPYTKANTQDGTYHVVEDKQTLFSIARQYGVTVDELKSLNNLTSTDLKTGSKLLVKKSGASEAFPPKTSGVVHVVAEKETLFSISKKYKISVDQIVRWNNLPNKEVKAGQKLVVGMPANDRVTLQSQKPKATEKTPELDLPKEDRDIKPAASDDRSESGYALPDESAQESRRYLAYHRTLPKGKVIRLRNRDNGKEVFVRIVGKLESEDSEVILTISKAAFDRIGGQGRTPVEIVYFD